MKKRKYLCWLLALAFLLSGCAAAQAEDTGSSQESTTQEDTVPTTVSVSQMFSDSDLEVGYDDLTSAHITLSGTTAAAGHGISDKDSVRIASGSYTITSGKDGIHAENTDDTTLGFLYIEDGTFSIHAQGDGLRAGVYLQIEGGDFFVTTGDGSASVTLETDSMGFGPGSFGAPADSTTEEDTVSQKGVKADCTLTISGGSFQIDTVDDAIHANEDSLIAGGEFNLRTGDDGIHTDTALTIQDGTFTIPYCYEGIEGLSITIDGGTYHITSADDGLNAAGGTDSSGFGGRMPGQEGFGGSSDSFIVINGGEFVVVSTGDCIDSNGSLTINGGTID